MDKRENDVVKANNEMNDELEDGKVHASTKGRSEAESANMAMQDRFRGETEESAEGVSPAFIYNPSMELNPEE